MVRQDTMTTQRDPGVKKPDWPWNRNFFMMGTRWLVSSHTGRDRYWSNFRQWYGLIDKPEMLAQGARRLVDQFVQACKDDELMWPFIDQRLAGRPIIEREWQQRDPCETFNVFQQLNWEPTKNRPERTEWLRQFIAWVDSGEPLMARERPPMRQCRLKLDLSKVVVQSVDQEEEEDLVSEDDPPSDGEDTDWNGSESE